jgi:hypothetical protein
MEQEAQLRAHIERLHGQVIALRTLVELLFIHSPPAAQTLVSMNLQSLEDLSMARPLADESIRAQQDLLGLVQQQAAQNLSR